MTSSMVSRFEKIYSDERIGLLATLAKQYEVQVFLVGGCLRDEVMGRPVHDFDFALSGCEEDLPVEFASRSGGRFFWLDRERRQARVVSGRAGDAFTCDFAPIRGRGIHDDLALRDFTINALALPVKHEGGRLLDPLHGMRDVAEGRIRACSSGVFNDDPLRLLRAVRFAATLAFTIEADTWQGMLKHTLLLESVAGERIRDELFLLLGAPNVAASLEMLRSSGLLPLIIPDVADNGEYLTNLAGQITFAAEAEQMLDECGRLFPADRVQLAAHLKCPVEGSIPLLSLLKLAAFLSGKDARKRIMSCAERVRLGTKARTELLTLCDCAASFPALAEDSPGERVLFRFFRDRAPGGPELVILPLAARLISPETAARLVSYYFRDYRSTDAKLLLSGDQVMDLLAIGPGRKLGMLLEVLREAESSGRVSSVGEAREFLLKYQLTTAEQ
ncbi:MAG: CCA tRNA nucleotidyltransferase [Deltaproteobacteria bacterium]|nr:CCA tRNA nucleotidyltransferase [Deltaproteobacteria bacterium]